jgi:hypothetical protein
MRIKQTPRGSVLCEAAVRVNAQTQNEANPLKKLIRTGIYVYVYFRTWVKEPLAHNRAQKRHSHEPQSVRISST